MKNEKPANESGERKRCRIPYERASEAGRMLARKRWHPEQFGQRLLPFAAEANVDKKDD